MIVDILRLGGLQWLWDLYYLFVRVVSELGLGMIDLVEATLGKQMEDKVRVGWECFESSILSWGIEKVPQERSFFVPKVDLEVELCSY